MTTPTTATRAAQVARVQANFALEGLHPDSTDKVMQASYIEGTATLADLMAYARAFALSTMARHARTSSPAFLA